LEGRLEAREEGSFLMETLQLGQELREEEEEGRGKRVVSE
jgi:hypothetical protein